MVDLEYAKELELDQYKINLNDIDNQYLNLIYNPLFDEIQERWVYEKSAGLMEWNCAICNCKILSDRNRNDVENFVCDKCKKQHNNNNIKIDRRILISRNKMYKFLENKLYQELEDKLNGGVV